MLLSERKNAIWLLTLDRAEKRNALHPNLIAELSKKLSEIETDLDTRVVLITGAGTSFCSGLDLSHLISLEAAGRITYLRSFFSLFSQIYCLRQPCIAVINGPAIAGGFDLAAACDLRLCSQDAQFGQTEVLLGITQMMYPIYKVIGLGRAKELALTGELISADEAHRIGLVNRVYRAEELLLEALKLAELLASRPKNALFATKKLGRDLIEANTESAIKLMFDTISDRLGSDEHKKELERYVERRMKTIARQKAPSAGEET